MCYHSSQEVNKMEEEIIQKSNSGSYARPTWQRIVAVIGILVILVGFLAYCWQIANGGI